MKPVFIIAEVGINHNGDVNMARQLIEAAKWAGVDAVKFQKRTVDVVYTPEELSRLRESPFGATNGDLKRGLEFGTDEYEQIDDVCFFHNIPWFASPWDVGSVGFLQKFEVPWYKVASACITDLSLLHAINGTQKPVIISTGMSTLGQIGKAVWCFPDRQDISLLVCTSTYPAKVEELNLSRIHTLMEVFPQFKIGYSGHEVGIWTTLCAVAMGAEVVERHITLDRSMWGSDQAASLEPKAFKKLVEEIRTFEQAFGDGQLGVIESEKVVLEKLRRFK